jgi:hypothetical protein
MAMMEAIALFTIKALILKLPAAGSAFSLFGLNNAREKMIKKNASKIKLACLQRRGPCALCATFSSS